MKKPIAWKYCPRCGKVISLDYYPFGRSIPDELDRMVEEHSLRLCELCSKVFPSCDAKKVVFGECVGNDNIIECDGFVRKNKETQK